MTDSNHPDLKSYINVDKDSDFPIQNLPYGAFTSAQNTEPHIGVAIGDEILDLSYLEKEKLISCSKPVFQNSTLNEFMSLAKDEWSNLRNQVSKLLRHDNPKLRDDNQRRSKAFLKQQDAKLQMPVAIGDYTDFYASKEHASNVGSMFRDKDNPLLPNWLHLPVGYHGRASSVIVSGQDIHRPMGQTMAPNQSAPALTECKRLDFELEMACFVGQGNPLGQPLSIDDSENHIFGLVLMNDWSARDIQKWEYVPLGPFTAKSFATTISPWVVSAEALEPFKVAGPEQSPQPLNYLRAKGNPMAHYDIKLSVDLTAHENQQSYNICQSNSKYLYWSMAQQLCHHTITGCGLRPGDLLATGTISGPEKNSWGSLLELSWGGKDPLELGDGITRTFIQDGDEITMKGHCQGAGYRIGFGEASGKIKPPIHKL